MAKFSSGIFTPKNPHKYVGVGSIKWRSSWEHVFMCFLDNNESVLQWASESIKIPYRNPLTGKQTVYIPDFFIYTQDVNGQNHGDIIEVKPKKETTMESAKSQKDKLAVILNMAKWTACRTWCASHGLRFIVVTEEQLFHQGKK